MFGAPAGRLVDLEATLSDMSARSGACARLYYDLCIFNTIPRVRRYLYWQLFISGMAFQVERGKGGGGGREGGRDREVKTGRGVET